MGFYEFASNSPWLTLFLVWMVGLILTAPFKYLFRHLNIRKAGWPPAHCDAGGNPTESKD